MGHSGRRKSSRKKEINSNLSPAHRIFRLVSIVAFSLVPIYVLFVLVHRLIGGLEWPMLSPYFWVLWFVIALTLTIIRAPTEELRDDPIAKTGFALGAINVLTAFVAILFSAR
jgi:hypothetical protein